MNTTIESPEIISTASIPPPQVVPATTMLEPSTSSTKKAKKAAKRTSLRVKLIVVVAVAVVVGLFGGVLVKILPDPVENAIGEVTESIEEATGVELDVFEEEEADAGSWSWGWYRFNYWETREIAKWTPWGCGSSCWAASLLVKWTWAFFPLMWTYKWAAQRALDQGKCLNIAFWGSARTGSCG